MTEADSQRAGKRVTGVWNVSLGDWNPSLETGMEAVDQQHRALFEQIRVLLDRSQADRVRGTIEFIATYASEHFDTEERLHHKTYYPYAEEQLDAHNKFIADYRNRKTLSMVQALRSLILEVPYNVNHTNPRIRSENAYHPGG